MVNLNNFEKHYDGFNLNISMELKEGMITGLIGKNGAGKSTIIKSILGIIKPDAGNVTVFGINAYDLSVKDKKNIGAALAESGFSGYLTVENVNTILKAMYDNFDESLFKRLTGEYGLSMKKPIHTLSTGMKAKLRVLTAICHGAKLLILDEPTAGLDVEARGDILDMLRKYMDEHDDCSVLITSHISSDLEDLCDEIYLINDGKVLLHEDTDVILSGYGVIKIEDINYSSIDKQFIVASEKTSYGYRCLTNNRDYYLKNYSKYVIEKCGIDNLILLMTGEK